MKLEPYLEINFLPDSEAPTFDLSFNVDDASFTVCELTEDEIKEFMQEVQDMLELLMGVFLVQSKERMVK